MKIIPLFFFALSSAVVLAAEKSAPASSASTDPIAADEQILATEIKALADPSNAVREAAAAKIRAIVARYPSHTVNIRDADGGAERWKAKFAELRAGMTWEEVKKTLSPLPLNYIPRDGPVTGSHGKVAYRLNLDEHWICGIGFDEGQKPGGVDRYNALAPALERSDRRVGVPVPADYTGTWTTWYSNGAKALETDFVSGKRGASKEYTSDGRVRVETIVLDAERQEEKRTTWQTDGSAVVEVTSPGKPVVTTQVPAPSK